MRPKIIIDDKIPFIRGAFEEVAEVEYLAGSSISATDVIDADALITRTRTKCNESLLQGSKVKFIASATIGFDHIDTDYCKENNIQWTNAPGCNSGSVLQYVLSALFAWERKYNFSLQDKTIGIVGVGNVGKKIAIAAKALGMEILLNDPPRAEQEGPEGFCSLDEIVEKADIITFHTPLNRSGKYCSFHLANEKFFKAVSNRDEDIFIINSSRGPVVNNYELKEALRENIRMHACMDVWENEPAIDLEVMQLADFATSHIAGYSADGKANGTRAAVQAVSKFLKLGLDDWEPAKPPHSQALEINERDDITTTLKKLHDISYSIEEDTKILKENPERFEKHRGDYRIRRELFTFPLQSNNPERLNQLRKRISQISF